MTLSRYSRDLQYFTSDTTATRLEALGFRCVELIKDIVSSACRVDTYRPRVVCDCECGFSGHF